MSDDERPAAPPPSAAAAAAGAAPASPGDGAGQDDEGEGGADAVRSALNRARTAARERGAVPGAAPASKRRRPRDDGSRSSARPDARDPQTLGTTLSRLVSERGWQDSVAVGGVVGRWEAVVGSEIAAHCTPETFEQGVLVVRADSTAWATQVRLLTATLLRKMADEVGEGTVTKVVVRGPSQPSWRRGPRVAPGSQGPRDTYG